MQFDSLPLQTCLGLVCQRGRGSLKKIIVRPGPIGKSKEPSQFKHLLNSDGHGGKDYCHVPPSNAESH